MILLLAGIPQAAIAGSAVPRVLVSAAPLQPLVDALLEGITHCAVLPRAGQDAHTMSLAPSQAEAIEHADIIIMPDRAMNPIIDRLAEKRGKHGPMVIALTELPGAEPLPYDDSQPWLEDPEAALKKPKEPSLFEKTAQKKAPKPEAPKAMVYDPHLWLDPLRMADLAVPLAQAMGQQAPTHAATLRRNAEALATHLRQNVHPMLAELLAAPVTHGKRYSPRTYIPFLTSHASYQYFLARYAIGYHGALLSRPEDYLGAGSSRDMLKRAQRVLLGCMIADQPGLLAQRVATAAHGEIVILNPETLPARNSMASAPWMQNDYDRFIYGVAKTFRRCLEK